MSVLAIVGILKYGPLVFDNQCIKDCIRNMSVNIYRSLPCLKGTCIQQMLQSTINVMQANEEPFYTQDTTNKSEIKGAVFVIRDVDRPACLKNSLFYFNYHRFFSYLTKTEEQTTGFPQSGTALVSHRNICILAIHFFNGAE